VAGGRTAAGLNPPALRGDLDYLAPGRAGATSLRADIHCAHPPAATPSTSSSTEPDAGWNSERHSVHASDEGAMPATQYRVSHGDHEAP